MYITKLRKIRLHAPSGVSSDAPLGVYIFLHMKKLYARGRVYLAIHPLVYICCSNIKFPVQKDILQM